MIKAIIHQEPYVTEISSETNFLIADEPVTHGGKASGMAPMELLASSLAACTCITVRMYANRKQWDVQSIETYIDIESKDTQTIFERKISFSGTLSNEQTERLLDIANHCPVHKLLTHTIKINTSIND
ncbi:MAG: OsmC family protein [Bacteroidia bacterium]|nr:OsmC family protein [Bacteroidia bacterium]